MLLSSLRYFASMEGLKIILSHAVVVPEWLSGMTRNHVGFARAGSNPADHGFDFCQMFGQIIIS